MQFVGSIYRDNGAVDQSADSAAAKFKLPGENTSRRERILKIGGDCFLMRDHSICREKPRFPSKMQ